MVLGAGRAGRAEIMVKTRVCYLTFAIAWLAAGVQAIQITEVMYHPQVNEAQNEWIELYNETSVRRDLSGWAFAEGIDFVFPEGTIMPSGSYLVIARDPAHIESTYGIRGVLGPFTGRLDNSSDHVILFDNAGGIMAEVDYEDRGKWPAEADGTGHTLTKIVLRGDPMDPDNWSASLLIGGTPGGPHRHGDWDEDTPLIEVGDVWRYFKGTTEASSPIEAWRQVGFDDSAWQEGATGIGYGDGDDATVLTDMQDNYMSVFCRKTFTCDPAAVDRLYLEIDHDDGFVAYLNGVEVGRWGLLSGPVTYTMPASDHEASGGDLNPRPITVLNITLFKGALATTNVLAVQVHNAGLSSDDLSFIPRLVSRSSHSAGEFENPIVINEVSFYTSGTQYVELHNSSNAPFDVGGHYLSNDPNVLGRYRIPSPTMIPAGGHLAFPQTQLGFSIPSVGSGVYLSAPDLGRVVDVRVVEPGPYEMTEGRWPDGAEAWYYMNATTGTANAVELTTSVVINEIMYHPSSDDVRDEYVELYNISDSTVDLTGWRFSRGIDYAFAAGRSIGPGQYLVIAKDRDYLIAKYGLNPVIVLGNYGGQLADSGEKIRLRDPNNNVADEVRYWDGGHWSGYADGYGSSLELIDPTQDNANYQAWAPSDETSKAQWVLILYTATVNDTNTSEMEEDELHLHLLAPGEVLVDDVQLVRGGTQYLGDTGFESGMGRWLAMGNHVQSHVISTDAFNGSRCLKIVATGDGDTGANHIEQDALQLMPDNATYTISIRAKWQYGCNLLLTRCFNNQAPKTHILPRPQNTGTPGAVNSVHRQNLGPVFSEVSHSPVIPNASDSVIVRARIHDPDGVQSATVSFKADNDSSFIPITMNDNGTGPDDVAGDGVFAATIPPRTFGRTVAFYFSALDGRGAINTWPTDASRPALYRIDNRLGAGFPTYRVILTSQEEASLFNGPHLSNEPHNCTFIFNETDVYHNCGIRFTGSPYGRRDSGYRGYKVTFNNDEKLHGVKWQARFDYQQNAGYRDRMAHQLIRRMDQPSCEVEYFDVRVNSRTENLHNGVNIFEDILPPGRRYLDMFYPGNDDGRLFELGARYYYTADVDTDLSEFSAVGSGWADWGNDKERYRWNYMIRNHDREDDYTSMIAVAKLYSRVPNGTTIQEMSRYINLRRWLTVTAVRTVSSDWDFRGVKNAFVYFRPSDGLMDLLPWDCELAFQLRDVDMNIWSNAGSRVRGFLQKGGNAHYYLNDVHRFLAHYFNHAYLDPWIDHYYSVAGGYSPATFKQFIDERRAYLDTQMVPYVSPRVGITITAPDPLTVPDLRANLIGVAPVNASWVRYRGKDYWLEWQSATYWGVTIDVPPGTNLVTLEFLDYDKQPIGTDSITIRAPLNAGIESWKGY